MIKVSRILRASDPDIASKFPPQLIKLLDKLNSFGEFYLVGGCIRDALLGRTPKDFDIMVVKPSPEELEKVLPVQKVGAAFPVYLYDTKDPDLGVIELAYARKETKQGEGYKGFSVEVVDNVKEDLARRDLTINALAWSPQKGLVSYGPESHTDLQSQTLRHVTEAFAEDPVRVLRAARFSAQLPGEWKIDPETLKMMASLKGELLKEPSDRVREELQKALKAAKPGNFFRNLDKADCLAGWFPEVESNLGSLTSVLDKAAGSGLIEMYCILAQFMGSDAEVRSFCKRLTLGCEREMLVWRSICESQLNTPEDFMQIWKSGRQGKLPHSSIYKLLELNGRGAIVSTLERVFSALKSLDYASVDPKTIPSIMLETIKKEI